MKTDRRSFPIVGIGASAGGLEAFTKLLAGLPAETGMAFLLVPHLDPDHASNLVDLLSRVSRLPISEASQGMRVEPDHVYVIPPNRSMILAGQSVKLRPKPAGHGPALLVDTFLKSLAAERHGQAIGVILSGTASDGAEGFRAIKAEGGVTFAQDPQTAKFDGMPRAAISTGCVDFVLDPAAMAMELVRLPAHAYLRAGHTESPAWTTQPGGALHNIFVLLRARAGVDFATYKPNTILRRIQRRMAVLKLHRIEDYALVLKRQPTEVTALYEDLLINVTEFFRDAGAFQSLRKRFFPALLKVRPHGAPIRVWVPGCASGEEVYSLAISLLEFLGDKAGEFPLQIFGTDISERSLAKARAGLYPASIETQVPKALLQRYFDRQTGGYQIGKDIREHCVFAVQNVTKDPPFSNLDLISCRNVMIYFSGLLQTRIMAIFHYALKPNGLLLLGASETIGVFSNLFTVADRKAKIYVRKYSASRPVFNFAPQEPRAEFAGPVKRPAGAGNPEFDIKKDADRLLLGRYAPASVLVNEDLEIIQVRGHTGAFLEAATGAASLNLLKMAREDLFLDLRSALQQARKRGVAVRKERLSVRTGNERKSIALEVIPFKATETGARLYLVVFEEQSRMDAAAPALPPAPAAPLLKAGASRELARLKQDLASNKEYLQSVIEDLESANEELKATTEEMQSSNEEMQSTNEELETAKEELQSSNEELTTVNDELQTRNQELGQTNNDLSNLLVSVNLPILMFGPNLCLRRATPAADKILRLSSRSIGRQIGELRLPLEVPDLQRLLAEAMNTLSVKEREVRDRDGHWYLLQVRPYRTTDNKIDGAVLALFDIDALKQALVAAQSARTYAETIIETVHEPLVVLDGELRVQTVNQAFCRMFQMVKDEAEGQLFYELGSREWNSPTLRQLLVEILPKHTQFQGYRIEYETPRLGRRTMMLSARRLAGDNPLILIVIEDVTDRLRLEMEIQQISETERQRIGRELHDGLAQQMVALQFMVSSVQTQLPAKAPEAKALGQVNQSLQAAMSQIRALSRGLFPAELKHGGIAVALQGMALSTAKLFKVQCTCTCTRAIVIADENRARQLYRIAQEAVTNAVKHSRGTLIKISLVEDNGLLTLTIHDNGRSTSRGRLKQTGMGMRIMQYRADIIGATLKIDCNPDRGTTVTCLCCNPAA